MRSRTPGLSFPDWLLDVLRTLAKRRWRGSTLSADEATQEVAVRLLSAPMSVDGIKAPQAFLGRALRNLAIDEARKVQARGGVSIALDILDDASAPWSAPDQESALLLKQVILGLPPLYRDTFVLNRFVGLTYAEIAQRYGITTKAVEYRMSRALALCQAALRD